MQGSGVTEAAENRWFIQPVWPVAVPHARIFQMKSSSFHSCPHQPPSRPRSICLMARRRVSYFFVLSTRDLGESLDA